jgi:hypothetical protein
VWTLFLPLALFAAAPEDLELDEILVEGRKPVRDPEKIVDWIRRLPGRFVVDGSVDLHGHGNSDAPLAVQGRSDCMAFQPMPAVQCELKLRWPEVRGANGEKILGGVSNLDPAALLYAYDTDHIGIRYMLVDSEGIAESASAYLLTGDTLVTRSKCVNVPGNCQRMMWITAAPELKQVSMRIELDVDSQRVASLNFVMHRIAGPPDDIFPGMTK